MIAAQVWHYWVGLILLIAGIGTIIAFVGGYLKEVTALKYPNRKQHQSQN